MDSRNFHFSDEDDLICLSCSSSDSLCSSNELHKCSKNCLNVKIKETLQLNCGMHVWPSAPVLGKYIWHNRKKLDNKFVLELGSGTGLISVVASKCGAYVVASDWCSSVLNITLENLKTNNCENFGIQKLIWGFLCPYLITLEKIDVILGSDVFYDPHDFENLIVTISYILRKNVNAEFWCAYEKRCSEWNIQLLMEKWNLLSEEIPLDRFGADNTNVADSNLPGLKEIQMFIFRSKSGV